MRKRIALIAIVPCLLVAVNACLADGTPLQISLSHPYQFFPEPYSVYGLRLGILYSKNCDVYGLDVCGLINEATEDAGGIEIAGVANSARNMAGIQLAGLANFVGIGLDAEETIVRLTGGQMTGLQVALGNMATDLSGIQVGFLNVGGADFLALSDRTGEKSAARRTDSSLYNIVTIGTMKGIQVGGLNIAGEMSGIQIGVLASLAERGGGLQLSGLISSAEEFAGVQLSLFNSAESMGGVQLGLYNRAGRFKGLQIGLSNEADDMYGIQIGIHNLIRSKPVLSVLPIINASF